MLRVSSPLLSTSLLQLEEFRAEELQFNQNIWLNAALWREIDKLCVMLEISNGK